MKTLTTIFISIIALVATANANNNLTITSATIATTSLNGASNNNTVVLNFSANSSNSSLEIERSFYSNNFSTIATMQTVFANNNFSINDNAAELAGRKVAYYRVKQTNANGTIAYSNVTVVNLDGTEQTPVVKKNTVINFTATQNGNAVIKIQTVTGQTAATKNILASNGNNAVEIDNISGLAKGIYTAVVYVNDVAVNTQKIIAE